MAETIPAKPSAPVAAPAAASLASVPAAATPPDANPQVLGHYHEGRLTRSGMLAVLARGGSVLYDGKSITTVDQLPSEAVMAKRHAEVDRLAITASRANLAAEEAAARQNGNFDFLASSFAERRASIDEAAAKLSTTTRASDEAARESIRQRREALDNEEQAIQATAKPAKR